MPYVKRVARCIECGNFMTAKADGNGNQYLMGLNECPNCECEDFEVVRYEGVGSSSKTASG